jgi:cytochrome P450
MVNIVGINISTPYLLVGVVVLYAAYRTATKFQKNARIRSLGARAPNRPSYAPMGLDIAYHAVNYALRDEIYEMWIEMFDKWCPGQHTIEAGIGERVIMTAEPENIKAILATQFKDYGKGERFRKDWFPFLGNGIFAADGEVWHNSRQLIRPQFIKDRLSDIQIFEEHVQVLFSKIGRGQEIDTLDLMFRYTLDAATHFLLGQSVDSLQNPQAEFAEAFANVQRVQSLVARVGYVRRTQLLKQD